VGDKLDGGGNVPGREMTGWADRPEPKAPGVRGEVAWEHVRARLDNAIGFWIAFFFSAMPAELRILRERAERQVVSEKRRFVFLTPKTPEELRALPNQLMEDRTLSNADLIWLEALHIEAPGAPDAPWTKAWEQAARDIEDLFNELRGVMLGGLVIAAPPALVEKLSQAAPELWSYKVMAFVVVPKNVAAVKPSAPVPPRGSRPSTSNMQAVDPDALVKLTQDKERLVQWAEEHPAPSVVPVSTSAQRAQAARTKVLVDAAEGFLRQGRLQDAKDAADEAMTLLRLRGDALDEARLLVVLAEIEVENGDFSRAAVKVQQAIAKYGAKEPGKVPPVWYCLAASIARERKEHGAAARFEELALASIRASRQGDERPEALIELADALERIGDARLNATKFPEAMAAFSECLLLRRRMLAVSPDEAEPIGEVSYTLKRLADAAVLANDLVSAIAACREAVTLDRKLSAKNRRNAEVTYQLADSLWRLGDLLKTNGEEVEATTISEEATLLLASAPPPSRLSVPGTRVGGPASRRRGGAS